MKDKIEKAISVCENMDFALNSEPAQLSVYREIAEEEEKAGKSEADITDALADAIQETVVIYLEANTESAEGTEKEVYQNTYFRTNVNENMELEFELSCNDKDFSIKTGDELRDIISDEIEYAEYCNREDESECYGKYEDEDEMDFDI